MHIAVLSITVVALALLVVSGGPAWKERNVQRGGGIKIGAGSSKNGTNTRGNGIRIGTSTGRTARITTTTYAPEEDHIQYPSIPTSSSKVVVLNIGMVVPLKSFGSREYTKAVNNAKSSLSRKLNDLFKKYDLQVRTVMKELTPSPTGKYIIRFVLITMQAEDNGYNVRSLAMKNKCAFELAWGQQGWLNAIIVNETILKND